MAELCAVLCTSHSPYLFSPGETWEDARQARAAAGGIAPHVPVDSEAENQAKHGRAMAALETLRQKLEAARPDVLLIFGDDQSEQFGFENYPALCVYAGEDFSGFKISPKFGLPVPKRAREDRPRTPEHWATVPGHPALAKHLITGLMAKGFDVGFSTALPRADDGIGHAFTRPLFHLAPGYDIPTVPFFVNCYYGPQPTAARCVALGRAVRALIEEMPADLRVAVIGSGGLWHMPMFPNADLDEVFDARMLEGVTSGDAETMAAHFDARKPDGDLSDPAVVGRQSGGTGMLLGIGGGSGEVRNWIIAAALAGKPGTVVDYIPAYASPVGLAFAHWSF